MCLIRSLCPTLCSTIDCSPPGSSVHGILWARVLEWVVIPFSRGIFPTQGLDLGLPHCRRILYHLSHQGNPLGRSFSRLIFPPLSLLSPLPDENHPHSFFCPHHPTNRALVTVIMTSLWTAKPRDHFSELILLDLSVGFDTDGPSLLFELLPLFGFPNTPLLVPPRPHEPFFLGLFSSSSSEHLI